MSANCALEPLLTLEEAGRLLGRSHWTVRHDVKVGTVKAIKVGRRWMVPPTEVRRILEHGMAVRVESGRAAVKA